MAYKILIERNAEKDLKKIPKEIQRKIILAILKLANDFRGVNSRKISGSLNYYRLRVGDYRIIYEVDDNQKEINIFRIRHRREAYQNLFK